MLNLELKTAIATKQREIELLTAELQKATKNKRAGQFSENEEVIRYEMMIALTLAIIDNCEDIIKRTDDPQVIRWALGSVAMAETIQKLLKKIGAI